MKKKMTARRETNGPSSWASDRWEGRVPIVAGAAGREHGVLIEVVNGLAARIGGMISLSETLSGAGRSHGRGVFRGEVGLGGVAELE